MKNMHYLRVCDIFMRIAKFSLTNIEIYTNFLSNLLKMMMDHYSDPFDRSKIKELRSLNLRKFCTV